MLFEFELPTGCARKHGRYYLIIRNKWHALSRIDEGTIPFWRAYYRLTKADPEFMAGVFLAYLEEGMGELTAATAAKYESYLLTRIVPYCGHIHRGDINSTDVARYLDERKKAGAPIAGNRERAAWSSACEFALRKGWMLSNPCRGVRRNKERPSKIYVEHAPLREGIDKAPFALQNLIAVAYLWGARQTDLRSLERSAVDRAIHSEPDKDQKRWVHIDESKTGKRRSHELTPTVRLFLDAAEEHRRAVAANHASHGRHEKAAQVLADRHAFLTPRGLPWTVWGLQSAMRRLGVDFSFREIRPKAASDAEHNILGHAAGMLSRYKRREKLKAIR